MQDSSSPWSAGTLWMLQTRSGKRTAKAALRIAVDMAEGGLITRDEAVLRIDPSALDQLLHPTLDPAADRNVIAKGLPASPGAACGKAVFDADTAERRAAWAKRDLTASKPHRTHSRMHAAAGILTRGGRQPREWWRAEGRLSLGASSLAIDYKTKKRASDA